MSVAEVRRGIGGEEVQILLARGVDDERSGAVGDHDIEGW
jgi:hypothetical protein